MNFYEQLFCRGRTTGEGMTHFERLFAAKFGGSPPPEVREYTGAVPVTITADGTPLIDLLISGNEEHTGTPTPTTPIQPSECGERTGNLCLVSQSNSIYYAALNNYSVNNNSVTVTGESLFGFICKVSPNTDYTVSAYADTIGAQLRIREYSDVPTGWSANYITQPINKPLATYADASFTTDSLTNYLLVVFYIPLAAATINIYNIMLNTGSTAKPYEPYGYKIPISSASTTTPVYLGEVETTRKIKKLVLTGLEDWTYSASGDKKRVFVTGFDRAQIAPALCSHFDNTDYVSYPDSGKFAVNASSTTQTMIFGITDMAITSATDWTTYLAQQYSAGTPVTVWYVLANEETGIVNEPLMKIGDYADTLSKAQALVSIPTNNGSTTVDVDTTVKPSEVYIKYMG